MTPIIRTILLCGRQGLALRGHRDDGPVSLTLSHENDGNFRTLLRFAIESGDSSLLNHIKTAPANATYLSPRIQNERIYVAGQLITKQLVQRINKFKYFSVLPDETTNVGGIEQFSLCVRYLDENVDTGVVSMREDFLHFTLLKNTSGEHKNTRK